MSLIHRLLQEIDDAEKRAGEMQCFISHEFRHTDLRARLERVLKQLGLHAYFADKELSGDFILHKVCKKILITRASIVDLTSVNPNVYVELGVAIGLNKPVFLVLKQHATVPPLLEGFVKLRFTSYTGLGRDLVTQAPGWLQESVTQHMRYTTHCHFVNVLCPDRQRLTPQRRYLVIDQREETDATGQPYLAPDPDLRAELLEALNRFHFTPVFLDEVSPGAGVRLCDYCRALRDSDFALIHLTRHTAQNVYLLLGLVTGLGIPSLLILHDERDREGRLSFILPSMLHGLDRFSYTSYREIGEKLGDSLEEFLHSTKHKPIKDRSLVFPDLRRREESIEEKELTLEEDEDVEQQVERAVPRILVQVDHDGNSALQKLGNRGYDVVLMDWMLSNNSGLDVLRHIKAKYPDLPVIIVSAPSLSSDIARLIEAGASKYILKPFDPGDILTAVKDIITHRQSKQPGGQQPFASLKSLTDPTEQYNRLAQLCRQVVEQGNAAGLREALTFSQSITDSVHQAEALIIVVDAMGQVNDDEGVRRVVEVGTALEDTETQERVLRAAAGAYERMGEGEKADLILRMIEISQPVNEIRSPSSHDQQSYTAQPLRVFLCHSSGDKPAVRALYRKLLAEGVMPWLDEEDLLPGQSWREEIPKAVRATDVVLVCLSHSSLDQAGYVHKEIKLALDVADEQPVGSTFVIPVRLEECNISDRLSNLHWVNLFEERGYERLMRALQHRAHQLGRVIAPSK
jgi:DNA-binding response OmpR family regulator